MRANTYELKQIMTPERRYVIPTFQRDYQWTRRGQWRLLFEDLDAAADRLGQARVNAQASGMSVEMAEKNVTPHFLGAMVCDRMPSPTGGLDLRVVIDGQQRLTTLQLLIRGVLDVLIEQDSRRVKQVRQMLENPPDVIVEPYEKHKLWPRRKDRLVWPIAMADELQPFGDHPYLKARLFFANATRTASTAVDGSDRTVHLVDALLGLFKLVMIDLEDNDDAQIIFEVLNGRQTPLSASDLVNNLLFLRGELANEKELEALYDRYWAEFDEDWWRKNIGTGHAARGRRDVLLSVWLTAASGEEANVGHLYGQVRAYLNKADRRTEDVLIELHAYGQAYKAIYAADEAGSGVLAGAYRRLDKVKLLTAVPLLAWLRILPPARLSLQDHERAVLAVESWLVRRMIIGANTRGYNAAFMSVLKTAQVAAGTTDVNIADAVVSGLADSPNSLVWPTDDAIHNAFRNTAYDGTFTQARIRFVLGSIDARMQADNPMTEPATFAYEGMPIEHVMPQEWRVNWPLGSMGGPKAQAAKLTRDSFVHRMGNLTLVTPIFDQSVSTGPWDEKKREFATQSSLQLNVAIASHENWDEESIGARADVLADVACQIWSSSSSLTSRG